MTEERTTREELKVTGDALVATIKQLLHESNVRRLTLKNEAGETLIEIPLTLGVVGVLFLPVWAAIGAIAALAAHLTIVVEKVDEQPGQALTGSAGGAAKAQDGSPSVDAGFRWGHARRRDRPALCTFLCSDRGVLRNLRVPFPVTYLRTGSLIAPC